MVNHIDRTSYTEGLHRVADHCYAWLEPPGGWGLSNSGVVRAGDEVLVIDTQNDMRMARAMRAALDQCFGSRDPAHTTIVNTHHDLDHWTGNGVFDAGRIIATDAAVKEMRSTPDPDSLPDLVEPDTAAGAWARGQAETFDFTAWTRVEPNESFAGSRTISLGDIAVHLVEVGPAHTPGDAIVHVPHDGVVFAGDIIFHRTTPISWASISGQIQACETILALAPDVVVPGHGSVTDQEGVREVRDYFSLVQDHARRSQAAGIPLEAAYQDIDLGPYRNWAHASRVYANLACAYAEAEGRPSPKPTEVMEQVIADDHALTRHSEQSTGGRQ